MFEGALDFEVDDWFEKGRCTLPIEVESLLKTDSWWVEVNLVTLTCWGYYQILNIGVSVSVQALCFVFGLANGCFAYVQ